jgi:hypothetical protein
MSVQEARKAKVAIMNAVHDLPVLVARDKGFFRDEGLDIDSSRPGMAQVTTSHVVKFDPCSIGRSTPSTTKAGSISTACASGGS